MTWPLRVRCRARAPWASCCSRGPRWKPGWRPAHRARACRCRAAAPGGGHGQSRPAAGLGLARKPLRAGYRLRQLDGRREPVCRWRLRDGGTCTCRATDEGSWNTQAVARACRCHGRGAGRVGVARARAGDDAGPWQFSGLAGLAGRTLAPRQPEAGSQILLDRLLASGGLGRVAQFGCLPRRRAASPMPF
jgi:hypothetical protein